MQELRLGELALETANRSMGAARCPGTLELRVFPRQVGGTSLPIATTAGSERSIDSSLVDALQVVSFATMDGVRLIASCGLSGRRRAVEGAQVVRQIVAAVRARSADRDCRPRGSVSAATRAPAGSRTSCADSPFAAAGARVRARRVALPPPSRERAHEVLSVADALLAK